MASARCWDQTAERYRGAAELGRGGMGVVQLSTDLRIGRDVAVKTLRSEHAGQRRAVGRFLREARVQGQLEHPAIVPVYDLGQTEDGEIFFTMKQVRGRTLADVITALCTGEHGEEQAFPNRRLLSAFSQVCLAVDFAHQRGVVHRDLKPENVMLGEFGEVYVLDWGIARTGPGAAEQDLLTSEGELRLSDDADTATRQGAAGLRSRGPCRRSPIPAPGSRSRTWTCGRSTDLETARCSSCRRGRPVSNGRTARASTGGTDEPLVAERPSDVRNSAPEHHRSGIRCSDSPLPSWS